MFNLTSKQFEEEPADELFTNLYILAQLNKKQELEAKHGNN
jgi:hypothetical protein